MLKKSYVRDGKHRIIGSVTSGFTGGFDTVVRDAREETVGRDERQVSDDAKCTG